MVAIEPEFDSQAGKRLGGRLMDLNSSRPGCIKVRLPSVPGHAVRNCISAFKSGLPLSPKLYQRVDWMDSDRRRHRAGCCRGGYSDRAQERIASSYTKS